MLLMVKKVSEVEYVMLFIDMQRLVKNTSKMIIKIKNLRMLTIGT